MNELVGEVLAGLSEDIHVKCNRAQILFALDGLGCAATMDDLREHMLASPDNIKSVVVGDPAPAFFFVRFQKAVTGPSDEPARGTTTPRAAMFADPASPVTACETCDDGVELSFDKALFNWLVEMCKDGGFAAHFVLSMCQMQLCARRGRRSSRSVQGAHTVLHAASAGAHALAYAHGCFRLHATCTCTCTWTP